MVLNLLRSRSTSVCQAKHLNRHAHAPKPTHDPMTKDYRVMIYAATRAEIEKRRSNCLARLFFEAILPVPGHCVEDGEELSRAGGDGDFDGFPGGFEALTEGAQCRVVA